MRTKFTEFLRKLYDMTGGDFRDIDPYEVGKELKFSKSETKAIVEQLFEVCMISKTSEKTIILSESALDVIRDNEINQSEVA